MSEPSKEAAQGKPVARRRRKARGLEGSRRPSRQHGPRSPPGSVEGGIALTPNHPTPRRAPGRRPRAGLLAALVAALATALGAAPAQAAPTATHIIQLQPGVTLAAGERLVREAGGEPAGRLPIIDGLGARLDARDAAALGRDARVEHVSRNAGVRQQSYDLGKIETAFPASVRAQQAWDNSAGDFTGKGVGVAVIDTGVAGHLPDFRGADGRSRVVASAVTNPLATTAGDTYGHGTHVAGILAGDGTRRASTDPLRSKYVGIAPEADLISVKVSDEAGVATVLDVIYGLQFVVDHKADYNIRVVNLSLESTVQESYKTDPLDAAVESAWFSGIVVVAAAGNHGATEAAANYAPGNDPFVITVGGVDDKGTNSNEDDVPATWSSVGRTQDGFAKPDIMAPGARMVSTLSPGSAFSALCPTCIVAGEYIRAGGTSMAAPVVSGVVAAMLQRHPEWTPDQVKAVLKSTGRSITGGVPEVNAGPAVAASTPTGTSPNAGIVPNTLVNPTTGAIDYSRSSWSRSSWSTASESLVAGFARSSWSCNCSMSGATIDPSRSSWSRSSWSTKWAY
jgi:serine protease AprX